MFQPIIPLEAKPLNLTNSLSSRCFSIYGTNTKQFNNNLMYLLVNGTSTTEFIWTGETGIFNLRKSISAGTEDAFDDSAANDEETASRRGG